MCPKYLRESVANVVDPDSVIEPGNYLVSVLRIHPVGLWQLKLNGLGVE